MRVGDPWPRVLGAIALCTCLLTPALGRAQPTAPAPAPAPAPDPAAQLLFNQAIAEMEANNYASACPKLKEVTRLVPGGLGAKLQLAKCYEGLGKLTSAWSEYMLVKDLATKAGDTKRIEEGGAKAEALQPRLAMMTIEVPPAARAIPGLTLTRDGEPMGEPQWGMPLPVDVGVHEIVVKAPGYKSFTKQVEVTKDGTQTSITVPVLELEQVRKQETSPLPPPPPPARPWQRPVGLAVLGVGAAGVALGAVLGGLSLSKNSASNADNHCFPNNRCDDTGLELRSTAIDLGNASTGALIGGVVLLAGGLTLTLTTPSTDTRRDRMEARRVGWSAGVAVAPGGLVVKGAW